MNKIKTILIVIAASIAAMSCDKYFDVKLDDQATLEEIFSQSSETKRYLAQLYSFIPLDEEIVGSHGWVVPRSDEALYSWYQYVYYLDFRSGNYSPSYAAAHFDYWSSFYIGINQCTIFMNNVDRDVEDSADLRAIMKAEARFLRAYYYFCLFRQYGPVFVWGDRDADEGIKGSQIDRNTVDENVDFIVSELDKCIEVLPLTIAGAGESAQRWQGRATKGAAMAVKARLLLYAASPLYNGCDLYKGQMINRAGKPLFPQQADPQKWEKAAQAFKDILDLQMYELCKVDTEEDQFQNYIRSVQEVHFKPWNNETIWGWWMRTSSAYNWTGAMGGAIVGCQIPQAFVGQSFGNSGVAPSLALVDAYPMAESGRYPVERYQKNGKVNDYSKPVVDPLSGYNPGLDVNDPASWVEGYHQPDAPWAPAIKAHVSTVGRDARYYANIVPNGYYFPCESQNKLFTCYNSPTCATPWSASNEVIRVGFMWRKNYQTDVAIKTIPEQQALKYVYPAFTLAEVLLGYAEACNEKPARDEAAALDAINQVRNRAGLNNIEVAYPEVRGNKEMLRDLIQRERMVELAFMCQRHYDACRWMVAKDQYPSENWTLNLSAETYEASYERVCDIFPTAPMRFDDKDYLFPMSSTRLSEMVNITQNYGF